MESEQQSKPEKRVRLRPETARKWRAIRGATRWTDTEIADALADEYMAAHGIKIESDRIHAKQPRTASAPPRKRGAA